MATENAVFTGEGFEVVTDASGVKTLWLKVSVGDAPVYDPVGIMPAIQERIVADKKPAGVLQKECKRIMLHVAQLSDAVSTLFDTYARMTQAVPQKRVGTAYKARYALLDSMKNKMLKEYASEYIPEELDNYILSDSEERDALIHRLCEIMVEEKASEEVS